jgi:transcriptional regulator with XRE-family HTH domain
MKENEIVPDSGIQKGMGKQIRAQRLQLNMTLSALAQYTGLTASTISQIERALISPSISTLKKICDALQIPIGLLFEDHADSDSESEKPMALTEAPPVPPAADTAVNFLAHTASPVVRKEKRKFLSPNPGVRYYLLTPNLSGPLELIYNEIDPGAGTGPPLYTHPGVESGIILSGELEVQINSETHILKEGDSITFNSSDPHLLYNPSDVMCTCIWANTPPWF